MELLDVIKRPVITEKSMLAMDEKKYTFEVDTRANKTRRVANASTFRSKKLLDRYNRYLLK